MYVCVKIIKICIRICTFEKETVNILRLPLFRDLTKTKANESYVLFDDYLSRKGFKNAEIS